MPVLNRGYWELSSRICTCPDCGCKTKRLDMLFDCVLCTQCSQRLLEQYLIDCVLLATEAEFAEEIIDDEAK